MKTLQLGWLRQTEDTVSTSGIVLIVTNKTDITADLVVLEFQRRGTPYARFNTEDFPQRVQISWEMNSHGIDGYIRLSHREIPLRDVISIWYRRPVAPEISETVQSSMLREFAHRESQEALSGLWRTMSCFWMSCPDAINAASYKPRQLKIANALGLNVPRTLISNSPEDVERFQAECGQIIAKPLFSGDIPWGNKRKVVFTTPLSHDSDLAKESIQLAPTIFQEYVCKEIELRVTVVGRTVLAASINSQEVCEAVDDWRRASPNTLSFRPYELPPYLADQCVRLVATFGLTFGTIDIIKTPGGDFVFLELNPNGQWGWLENATGDPYTKTIATQLERGEVLG